jgi:nitrate reductase gamma subunit
VLSIDEFNAAASAHTRRVMVAAGGAVAGMVACFGLAALLRQPLHGSLSAQLGEVGAEVLFVVVPFLAILVFLTAMWLGYRRGRRDERLLCPHCHTLLVQHQHLVVATRNCVQCGRRVLAEPV